MLVDFAPPTRCVRRMHRGQVKRTPSRGPLVGYSIVCPACGGIRIYLHDRWKFREGPWTVSVKPLLDERHDDGDEDAPPPALVNVHHPTGLSADPIPCNRCGHTITIKDGEIS